MSPIIIEIISFLFFLCLVFIFIKSTSGVPSYLNISPNIFNIKDYHAGDLIVSFGNYLPNIHPGHLSLVVDIPCYNQLGVWDLDSSEKTFILKPLQYFLWKRYKANKRIFVVHINKPIPKLLTVVKQFNNVKYEYEGVLKYAQYLLKKYVYLPGLPALPGLSTSSSFYYCSEAILRILIKVGVISSSIWNNFPDDGVEDAQFHLFYPKLLLEHPDFLSKYCLPEYNYKRLTRIEFLL